MSEKVFGAPQRGLFTAEVAGDSMLPTLRGGDVLLVRAARDDAAYRAGSLALVHFDARPGRIMVKRVVRRADGGLWVLGDNPAASDASEKFGAAHPLGIVLARLWPRPRLARAMTAP